MDRQGTAGAESDSPVSGCTGASAGVCRGERLVGQYDTESAFQRFL